MAKSKQSGHSTITTRPSSRSTVGRGVKLNLSKDGSSPAEQVSGREFPELGARLFRLNPGIFAALLAIKTLIQINRPITRGTIISMTRGMKPTRVAAGLVQTAVTELIHDEVLSASTDNDGTFKLNLSKLEERIEIYNETP